MTTGDTQFGLTGTDSPRNTDHEMSQTFSGISAVQGSANSGATQGLTSKDDISSSSSILSEQHSRENECVNSTVKPKPPSTLRPLGLSNTFLPNHNENVLEAGSASILADTAIRSNHENDPDVWLDDSTNSWNGNVDLNSNRHEASSVDQTGGPIYSNGVHAAEETSTVLPNYFESLAFSPDYSSSGAFSPLDFNPQSAPYLSPQQAAAAAAAVGFSPFYNISPDYPSWAQGPGTFDFAPTLTSPVDTNTSLKLLEQNFTNLSLFGPATAGSPLHAIDFANYQALFPPGKNKSYAKITGQPTAIGVSSRNYQKPRQQRWNNGINTNSFGGGPVSSHNRQHTNCYYHRPQHPQTMPDIGTWGYNDDFSANKTMTRSGKIVPTPSEKENEVLRKLKQNNNYNPADFNCNPKEGKFFVIKSYSEDDIHRSIKYKIWCSTERGNRKLNECYGRFHNKGPIYLMFSVNGSGHFCGVAEMKSFVDLETQQKVWSQSKWKGSFDVEWIFVKDVPNSQLRHIRLENNENKPVTNSRDTQEIPFEKGKLILKVFHKYEHETSLFDDFSHYESREIEANAGTAAEGDLQHSLGRAAVGLDDTLVSYEPLNHTVDGSNGPVVCGAEVHQNTDCETGPLNNSLLLTVASTNTSENTIVNTNGVAAENPGISDKEIKNSSVEKHRRTLTNCSEMNSFCSFPNSCPPPSQITEPVNVTSPIEPFTSP